MSTRIAVMQPYLFPYKGYFDLIESVDKFVVYDDAQWIKGGWINRNYFPERFTFSVAKHPRSAKINECYYYNLKADIERFPIKNNLTEYVFMRMAPNYSVSYNNILALEEVCRHLKIKTPFYVSSDIQHRRGAQGLVDIVNKLGGTTYVNSPGGRDLYTQEQFGDIKLEFIETEVGHSIICECCSLVTGNRS